MLYFNKASNKIIKCPAFASQIVDKIGAGDTMLAYLSLAVFKKINTKIGMFMSSLAAAFNVENAANSKVLKKIDIIKSAESYLK